MHIYRNLFVAFSILGLVSLNVAADNEDRCPLSPPIPFVANNSHSLPQIENVPCSQWTPPGYFPPPSDKFMTYETPSSTSLMNKTPYTNISRGSIVCPLDEERNPTSPVKSVSESPISTASYISQFFETIMLFVTGLLEAVARFGTSLLETLYEAVGPFFGSNSTLSAVHNSTASVVITLNDTSSTNATSMNSTNATSMNSTDASADATLGEKSPLAVIFEMIPAWLIPKFLKSIFIFFYGFSGLLNPLYFPILMLKLSLIGIVMVSFIHARLFNSAKKDGSSLESPFWTTFVFFFVVAILRCGL